MKPVLDRINSEPAAAAEVVRALLLVGVLFGLPLSDQQTAGLLLLTSAVLTFYTRKNVTPSK